MPAPRREIKATVRKRSITPVDIDNFGGLNLVAQDDAMEVEASPHLQNVRKFALKKADRRVGISTRKGSGFYTVPIGEAVDTTLAAAGTGDAVVSLTNWQAMSFTPTASERLTLASLSLKKNTGSGTVRVEILSDNSGLPGDVLAESSIALEDITDAYTDLECRFIAAPLLDNATQYWIAAYVQAGGTGEFHWEQSAGSDAAESTIGSGGFAASAYSLNFTVSVSDDGGVKGVSRYYPTSNVIETLMAHGTNLYTVTDSTGATTSIKSGLDATAETYQFSYFQDLALVCNGKDTPQQYDGTTVSDLGGSPIVASQGVFHKNRLFLVAPGDTRLEFSEIADFENFLSVNFIYVPRPLSTDPLQTAISFQDNLTCFTRHSKYILYGSNLSNFELRQSLGKNGVTSPNAVASDGNYLYFLSDDNFYRFNGATDEGIGDAIQPLLDSIPDKENVSVEYNDNEVRLYYAKDGQSAPSKIAIFNTIFDEWFVDTEAYAQRTTVFNQEDGTLIEGSSLVGALYKANQDYNNLGAPIKAEYFTKYHSFGQSSINKRIRKLFTVLRTQATNTEVTLQVDRDFQEQVKSYTINAAGSGTKWDEFNWDEANWATVGIITDKKTISGNANYTQFRYINHGVDTPMELIKVIIWYQRGRLI